MDFGWGLCLKNKIVFSFIYSMQKRMFGVNLMSLEEIWQKIINFSTTF